MYSSPESSNDDDDDNGDDDHNNNNNTSCPNKKNTANLQDHNTFKRLCLYLPSVQIPALGGPAEVGSLATFVTISCESLSPHCNPHLSHAPACLCLCKKKVEVACTKRDVNVTLYNVDDCLHCHYAQPWIKGFVSKMMRTK